MIAEAREGFLRQSEHLLVSKLAESENALVFGNRKPLVAIGSDDVLSDVGNVAAAIALLGHLDVLAKSLKVADVHAVREHIKLNTVVVDVELFVHVVAGMTHDASHSIAQSSPTTMTDMHGTGGVRRNVLKVDATGFSLTATIVEALLANSSHNALQHRCGKTEVDETGTSDLGRSDDVVLGEVVDERLGDIARALVGELRRTHGNRGSPIAVRRVTRTLERSLRGLGHV